MHFYVVAEQTALTSDERSNVVNIGVVVDGGSGGGGGGGVAVVFTFKTVPISLSSTSICPTILNPTYGAVDSRFPWSQAIYLEKGTVF